jgi:hypothetical protein
MSTEIIIASKGIFLTFVGKKIKQDSIMKTPRFKTLLYHITVRTIQKM